MTAKEKCHFLCGKSAQHEVTLTDDHGEYLTNFRVCETCHDMIDHDYKRFKWEFVNNQNENM